MSEVARYKVLRQSYINLQIFEEGEEVEYVGKPGSALEPINEAAKLAKAGTVVLAELAVGDGADIELPGSTLLVESAELATDASTEAALQLLREEYEGLFGKKPHPATQEETLKTKIAEKRKELGFI
ncbi:hypothetical protein HB991_13555 [Yersinia mollaretii]|uniref:Uncharacterized protein n=1 Tax=Yersinia mollaretii TaxID=33060 RepID=A0AA44CMK5_YERMO|nr:hypothetical protein [Yersinia mollaretii]NIL23530.1 hypothetical protein [Yersinia mollaretii]